MSKNKKKKTDLFQDDKQPIDARSALISEAIKREDVNYIKSFLQKENIFSKRKVHSCWLLHEAIDTKNTEIVSTLLKHGVCVESCASVKSPDSAIHKAVIKGHKPVIEVLLLYKVNWQKLNKNGDTVLHLAFNNNSLNNNQVPIDRRAEEKAQSEKIIIQIIELFLNRGMNVNVNNRKKRTPLFLAASHRMINVAKYLLGRGANISNDEFIHSLILDESESFAREKGSGNWDPELLLCIQKDNIEFFDWFLSTGLNTGRNRKGKTPLELALKYNMIYLVPTLLKYTDDIMMEGPGRKTLLHILLQDNSYKMDPPGDDATYFALRNQPQDIEEAAKIMISKGIPMNTSDACSMTPCGLAAQQKRTGLIKFILDRDSSPDIVTFIFPHVKLWLDEVDDRHKDEIDEIVSILVSKDLFVHSHMHFTMVIFLYAIKHKLEKTIEAVRARGFDFRSCTPRGDNLLHIAVSEHSLLNKKTNSEDVMTFLVRQGCDVNRKKTDGSTPLYDAITFANFEAAKILINHGANLNERYPGRKTPLHLAVIYYHIYKRGSQLSRMKSIIDIVKYMIEKGCYVDSETDESKTPLHQACESSCFMVAKILVLCGAKINARKQDGKTPLHLAVMTTEKSGTINSENIVEFLIRYGSDIRSKTNDGKTPLHIAAGFGHFSGVKSLIARGVDIEAKDRILYTPLHLAAKENYENVVKFLIESGANVNAKQRDFLTPLHLAITGNSPTVNEDVLEYLIKKGSNVNSKSKKGTPLHEAASTGKVAAVKILIKNGADINAKDNQLQYTPLHIATKRDRKAVIEILVESGADINARDKNGQTPLQTAIIHGRNDVLKILLRLGADCDAEDNENMVPLQTALRHQNKIALECLLEYSAETTNIETMELPFDYNGIWDTIYQHFYKLQTLGLPVPKVFRPYLNYYNEKYDSMHFAERNNLMKFVIQGSLTMYDLLHMKSAERFHYTQHEKFNDLTSWVDQEFPLYRIIILASFRDANERKRLREPAKIAWLELTGEYLPDICMDRIIYFSTNKTLKVMVGELENNKSLKRPTESNLGNVAKKVNTLN